MPVSIPKELMPDVAIKKASKKGPLVPTETFWEQTKKAALADIDKSIEEAIGRYVNNEPYEKMSEDGKYKASRCWKVVGERNPENTKEETIEVYLKVHGIVIEGAFDDGTGYPKTRIKYNRRPDIAIAMLKGLRDFVAGLQGKDSDPVAKGMYEAALKKRITSAQNKQWGLDPKTDMMFLKETAE